LEDFAEFDGARLCPEICSSRELQERGTAIKEAVPAEESVGPVPAAGLRGFLANFTVLRGAQRELG